MHQSKNNINSHCSAGVPKHKADLGSVQGWLLLVLMHSADGLCLLYKHQESLCQPWASVNSAVWKEWEIEREIAYTSPLEFILHSGPLSLIVPFSICQTFYLLSMYHSVPASLWFSSSHPYHLNLHHPFFKISLFFLFIHSIMFLHFIWRDIYAINANSYLKLNCNLNTEGGVAEARYFTKIKME